MKTKINTKQNDDINLRISCNYKELDIINGWIRVADTKVQILLAAYSTIYSFLFKQYESNLSAILDIEGQSIGNYAKSNFFIVLSAVFLLVMLFIGGSVLFPKLISDDRTNTFSLFYGEISSFEDANSYVEASNKVSEKEYNEEVIKEIYYNSKICTKKMNKYRYALIFTGLSLASIILGLLLLF